MGASSLKGSNHGGISFVSRRTKGCKWPDRACHDGPRKDGTVIEVELALVVWNQGLSKEQGKSARQKIEYMRGDKEFRGRGREKGTSE